MKNHLSAAGLGVIFLSGVGTVDAQGFTIGDRVTCDGATGTIVRTEPRPGWDEPSSIVKLEGSGAGTEYRCLQARMRAAPGAPVNAPDYRADTVPPSPQAAESPARLMQAAVVDDTAATGTTAPDGNYRCHKISPGGQLLDIGDLDIAGGRATMQGMPESWVVRSVSLIGKDDRGQPLVAVDYTSAAGWNDRLDCVPR